MKTEREPSITTRTPPRTPASKVIIRVLASIGSSIRRHPLRPVFVAAFLMCATLPAWAGEYFVIERERYPLCRELAENFNRFKNDPPMVCERKFDPAFKDFRLPKWESLNPKDYVDTLERLLVKESSHPWTPGIPGLRKRIQEGKVRLWRARIDINFDGRPNTVYKMEESRCDPIRDLTRDNVPRFRFMAEQNDPDPEYPRFRYLNGMVFGGVFLYKGRPYFHSWMQWPFFVSDRSRHFEGPSPRIGVYETASSYRFQESFALIPVCEIGYQQ